MAEDGLRGAAAGREWGGRGWDAYFGTVLGATLVYLLLAPDARRLAAAALLLVMAALYLAVGRRMILAVRPGAGQPPETVAGRRGQAVATWYITALVAAAMAASAAAPGATVVLFAVVPQCFILLAMARAVLAVLAVNVLPLAGALLWQPMSGDTAAAATVFAAGDIAFSVVFGVWVNRIITQSAERRLLIAELRASRGEVARLSAAEGALRERERLAREIHDTLAQGFTSIVMLGQAAESGLEGDPESARRHLRLIGETARENLAEARDLVAALSPAHLADGSLEEAVRRLGARLADETGAAVDVAVSGTGTVALAPAAEVVALRCCQEALANVRKHAGAGAVSVGLAYTADGLALAVRDDGRGFDPAACEAGYGLPGMRARLAEIGGRAEVRSAPGTGTEVRVWLRSG